MRRFIIVSLWGEGVEFCGAGILGKLKRPLWGAFLLTLVVVAVNSRGRSGRRPN